jgi:peptide/nickel transport system substrate-binding protein
MRKVVTTLVLVVVAVGLIGLLIHLAKRPSPRPKGRIPTNEQLPSPPAYGDTIIEASIGDASYLNPILASDSASGDINGYVYNGLVKYDKNLKLVGDLAESWDISEEGLVITFHLRKNVKWHDGEPFTSDDVNFTYEKLVDTNTRTPYASDYLMIDRFEIIDPHTVKIRYKKPFSPALESWGMGIVPKHIFEKGDFNNHHANRHPIGTGPYKFVDWKTDERIVLEANGDYFEGRPYIDRIIYRIMPDEAVQFLELRKGTIDTMGLTPDQFQKEAVSEEFLDSFNKFRYPSFGYTYLGYNLKNPLFENKSVRQAITYAINRQEIIDGVLLGLGQVSTGPFPPTSWAYNKNVPVYEYNPEKAKELLCKCGWRDRDGNGILEKDGKPFSFTLMTNQGNKMRELCATIIQSNLRAVGIQVNIRILEWAAFIHQYIDKKNFDAVLLGWSLSRDPDQYAIWHSSQIKEGQYNFISYNNPEVDRLLVEGRRTFDMQKRKEIYHKIHAILAEEQPYTFLYVADALPIVHNRFHGIEVAPAGIGYNFIKWYVPKDQQKYTR